MINATIFIVGHAQLPVVSTHIKFPRCSTAERRKSVQIKMAPTVEKVEVRAVIRFLQLKGKSAKEIHAELVTVYGDNAPQYATVAKWQTCFQCGQTSLDDDERSGRPSLSEEPGIAAQLEALVLEDRRITIEAIVQKIHVSHGAVQNIIHNVLHMSKVSARWVPRLLTPMQTEV